MQRRSFFALLLASPLAKALGIARPAPPAPTLTVVAIDWATKTVTFSGHLPCPLDQPRRTTATEYTLTTADKGQPLRQGQTVWQGQTVYLDPPTFLAPFTKRR